MNHVDGYLHSTELTAFFMFCVFLFNPVLAPYVKSLGFSDFQVGLLYALFSFTMLITSATFGSLSDVIGRKKVMIAGIMVQVVAIALYLSGLWYLVIVARFLEALAYSAVVIVGLAGLQDSLESKTRGKYSGFALSIMHVGKLIAPVIGGFLADYMFVRAPFLLSMFALLVMLWLVSMRESLVVKHKFSASDFNFFDKVRMFFSDPRLRGMGILGIVMNATSPITSVFIPIYIVESFGLPYRYVGYAFFALEFFMLFQFAAGMLCDRVSQPWLIIIGALVIGVSFIVLAFMHSYVFFFIMLLCVGAGIALWNVSAWAFMSGIAAETGRQGFVMGTYASIAMVGPLISFLFGGAIVQWFGIQVLMWIISFVIIVGCIAASFFIFRRPAKAVSRR
jgi:MFS family permease